ncbi:hypothetical protein QW180_25430 [Vibrio sinaloensis]|nr:hypothetical protein [Vibrio sinaloensis]
MINSEYALTAAHCIYGQDETMLYTVVAPQLEDEAQFLSSTQARVVEFLLSRYLLRLFLYLVAGRHCDSQTRVTTSSGRYA